MAYSTTNTNMTTSTGLADGMQTYYDRKLLKTFEPKLVHAQFAQQYPIPPNNGKTINMRKLTPLEGSTTALSEGNPGDGILFAETDVTATVAQYGQYANVTDLFDMTHMDLHLAQRVEMMGNAGARSVDKLVRDELATCTNVIYANGKTARNELAATDKLTSTELKKAVRTLKMNLAQPFDGYYIAIVGPQVMYDLMDDDNFIKVSQYQDKENIYKGELGSLFGVRLIETTEMKVFEDAGASSADVASVIVLGQYAYGITSIRSAAPHVIVKPAGSAGTADPLNQISTVGWKLDAFAAKLIQPEYAVRIECGFSA